MKNTLKETLLLLIVAGLLAVIANAVSPNRVRYVGTWYDNREVTKLDIPPSYDPEVDSLLGMAEAFALWKSEALFIDAREPEEYAEGHIPGAINLPFEHWDDYWDKVEPLLTADTTIVCYCGGLDCELSLFAARELKACGYPNAYTFFGGYNKWIDEGLPIEPKHGE